MLRWAGISPSRRTAALVTLLLSVVPVAAVAASTPQPAPTVNQFHLNQRLKAAAAPTLPPNLRLPNAPKAPLRTTFVVEVNKKGQVTRVRSGTSSPDAKFNAMTYGNALQAFIRTASGSVVVGTYRLTYDYSPVSKQVKRGVTLVRRGGVNPNAIGAVDEMAQVNARHALRARASKKP